MYVWSASVPDSLILSLWFCQPSYFYVRHLPCDIWSSKIQTEKSDFSHSPGTLLKARQCITHFLIIIITFVIILNVSNKLKVKLAVLSNSFWPHGLYSTWNSPGKNTGVGSHSLLQGSSQPRNQTQVLCIAGRFFTIWAIWEALTRSKF